MDLTHIPDLPHKRRPWLTTAVLSWFDDACCDVKYLDRWHKVPLNYQPGQATGPGWHRDRHEHILAERGSTHRFRCAAHALMTYNFYPPDLMSSASTFKLFQRWPRVGDRIVQRIHLLNLPGTPVLDVLGMVEITQVEQQPRQVGFTYVTTAVHAEMGEWSVQLTWDALGPIRLTMTAVSRPDPAEPRRNYRFMRAIQKSAHLRGLTHFSQLVNAS